MTNQVVYIREINKAFCGFIDQCYFQDVRPQNCTSGDVYTVKFKSLFEFLFLIWRWTPAPTQAHKDTCTHPDTDESIDKDPIYAHTNIPFIPIDSPWCTPTHRQLSHTHTHPHTINCVPYVLLLNPPHSFYFIHSYRRMVYLMYYS